MILKILFSFVFLLLQALDFYLTKLVLKKGGIELNPIFKYIGMIPVKVISSILIVGGIFYLTVVGIIPIVIMICVCIWNYKQYRK